MISKLTPFKLPLPSFGSPWTWNRVLITSKGHTNVAAITPKKNPKIHQTPSRKSPQYLQSKPRRSHQQQRRKQRCIEGPAWTDYDALDASLQTDVKDQEKLRLPPNSRVTSFSREITATFQRRMASKASPVSSSRINGAWDLSFRWDRRGERDRHWSLALSLSLSRSLEVWRAGYG